MTVIYLMRLQYKLLTFIYRSSGSFDNVLSAFHVWRTTNASIWLCTKIYIHQFIATHVCCRVVRVLSHATTDNRSKHNVFLMDFLWNERQKRGNVSFDFIYLINVRLARVKSFVHARLDRASFCCYRFQKRFRRPRMSYLQKYHLKYHFRSVADEKDCDRLLLMSKSI